MAYDSWASEKLLIMQKNLFIYNFEQILFSIKVI